MTQNAKMLEVVRRALLDAESLPVNDRADLYEGVACLLENHLRNESDVAWKAATFLREAEAHQLNFNLLMKEGAR